MPELPEVESVCRTLDPLLTGQRFVTTELLWPGTIQAPEPDEFARLLVDRAIVGVSRRAKLILIELDDGALVTVHLRMTGELFFDAAGSATRDLERDRFLRWSALFESGSALLFYDIRKFGRITYIDADDRARLDAAFGIEPLDSAFTGDALQRILQRRKRMIKPLLLDQTVVAGLGNIYVDEALFRAGIHPLARSNDVKSAQAAALRDAIVTVLETSIAHQGTTLRDYRSGLGETGENQRNLLVYGRAGSPCTHCGTPLERIVVGQRGTVFCPKCQRLRPKRRSVRR